MCGAALLRKNCTLEKTSLVLTGIVVETGVGGWGTKKTLLNKLTGQSECVIKTFVCFACVLKSEKHEETNGVPKDSQSEKHRVKQMNKERKLT